MKMLFEADGGAAILKSTVRSKNLVTINFVACMHGLKVQWISLNWTPVNQTFRKWVGCEALAPIQDSGSL